jgi:NAD(P)H dehydrogenase (quinone)
MATRSMASSAEFPVLVAGASGHFGRRLVTHLLDTHEVAGEDIIATTRTPERVSDLAARGVAVRYADYAKPDTIYGACSGAARAFFTPTLLDPAPGKTRGEVQVEAVTAAIAAGVPHLLYASAPHAEPGVPAWWHLDHHMTERALIDSGRSWTILRNWEWPNYYYHLFGWKQALTTGYYHTFAGHAGTSFVTRDDCAAAAAAALVSSTSRNRRFDLTGPAVLSADDVFAILYRLTGKSVTVLHCTPEEWEAGYLEAGNEEERIPRERARMLMQLGGWFAGLSDGVAELTGRPPMALEPYLRGLVG